MKFNNSKYNQHWQNKRLEELGSFKRGKSRHRPRNDPALFINGTYPLIQTGEIKEANLYIHSHQDTYNDFGLKQSHLWKKDTLAITIAANIAETALLAYPMCFPDSVVGFVANKEQSSELFMHYVFTYIRKSIQSSASGSIQDNINIDYLAKLTFKIPEKAYQDKITTILSKIDKKIEINNRINAELEAMAKTLYDYWFVQFDFPFDFAQGKPDPNGKPYKSSGGKMIYNETLKREIPEGWEAENIMQVSELLGGGTPSKKETKYWNGDIPFFTPTDTTKNIFQLTTEEYISDAGLKNCSSLLFDKGTIFITARGSVGKLALTAKKMAMNQSCYALKPKTDYSSTYLYFLTQDLIHYLKVKSSGSVFKSIVSNDIKLTQMCIPEKKVVKAFSKIAEPLFGKILNNTKENQQLTQLRDWLLPMLMNGQVRVTDK